jgi:vancomycin permeability regulator SanA
MGFRKPMDYNAVSHQIYMSGVELNSPRNDGFVQWEIKKDLLRLKFLLDEILKDSPEFVGEPEFLQEQSKKQMWRALNEV